MKAGIVLCAALLLLGCDQDGFPSDLQPEPLARIQPAQDPYYGPPDRPIRQLLLERGKNAQTNHFCVVGYAYPGQTVNVWVHWRETQQLLLWRGNSDVETRERGLLSARRSLELGKDTVATRADLQGSTYLVTRAWWQSVADDCKAHGEQFTIEPFVGP